MGVHVEWSHATETSVEVVLPGTPVGSDGEVDAGNFGLVVGGDSLHVIEGTADELRRFATRVSTAVANLRGAPRIKEIRASELFTSAEKATHFRDYGGDGEWFKIVKVDAHGDAVLVTYDGKQETTYDGDEAIEVLLPADEGRI